ncbi:FAD binding domain-containing protein [Coprinopsis sp. MPI-PUGE-AT-0042]|nr:FAD binding domain-containing protein [Coprinopsis sp. MPI-PUGE-AT-0042]
MRAGRLLPLWTALNTTVEGNLRRVIPDPAVCYNTFEGINTYNQAACQQVTQNWSQLWQSDQAVSNHWILWTNNTCLPTTNRNAQCTIGHLPRYVILAKKREHIKAGIDFARTNNIRLVIRNTGHDLAFARTQPLQRLHGGRSTGYGSLAINTHTFKDVTFTPQLRCAVTVGAGIQGRELLRLANQQNPKVAITVGGHGPLASYYGMDGVFRTANAVENPDLFWAPPSRRRPHPQWLQCREQLESFWGVPQPRQSWVENGMFGYYEMFSGFFSVRPFVGPNMNAAKINQVLQPLYDQLRSQNIPIYSTESKEYLQTFLDLYIDLFQDEGAGGQLTRWRTRVHEAGYRSTRGTRSLPAYRRSNAGIVGHIVGPGFGAPSVDNAIHPGWRTASSFSITSVTCQTSTHKLKLVQADRQLTTDVDGPSSRLGNLAQPNWQRRELRPNGDPQGVFYARTTPGTELWRLCKRPS